MPSSLILELVIHPVSIVFSTIAALYFCCPTAVETVEVPSMYIRVKSVNSNLLLI